MSDPPSRLAAFLAELKRRRVFRVAVVYAGVAFVIIQIIDGAFEPMGIPLWVSRLLIIMLGLGFPVSIGLAWAFDITDKGIVRTAAKGPEEAKVAHRPLIGNKALAVVAALAIIVAGWSWLRSPGETFPDKSIAVLPFANLSDSKADEYFSDGITEDIMAHLAKISELTVIGRTSVMQYKGTTKRLRDIGEELGVASLLEGSVRRAGGKVRIVSQLIDAGTEKHLWAATYDREVDEAEIFALQSDVAGRIATALEATLLPKEKQQIEKRPTANMAAYEAYLKGRYFWNKRTREGMKKAIDYFELAIAADSNFALGYAGLADAYSVMPVYGILSPVKAYPRAKAAVTKALEIDNMLAEAHTTLAWIKVIYDWKWDQAEQEFKRAIEINPSYANAPHWYAVFLSGLGRHDEALVRVKRALMLDPLSLIINDDVAWVLFLARKYDQAIEQYQMTLDMDPSFITAHHEIGLTYEQKGMYEEAITEFQKVAELSGEEPRASLAHAYAVSGRKDRARRILIELIGFSDEEYISPYEIAMVYAGLEEKDEAFKWLEKAYDERSSWLLWLNVDPRLDPLRDHPRFQDLLRRMNFPE